MNHNGGIQFFGIDSVVQAYANRQVPAFSLWAGKVLLLKYDGNGPDGYKAPTIEEGQQLLNDYLNAMYQGTTAIYTLKVYDELGPREKIKPSTEYDTAFNFKINVPSSDNSMIPYGGGRMGNAAVAAALEKINSRLDMIEAGEPIEDDEPQDLIGTVNGLLQEPEKLREVVDSISILGDVVKGFFGMPVQNRAALGNINRVSDINSDVDPRQQDVIRLQNALDELERHDPKIVDHLEKLAQIAKQNPNKFKSLLGMLSLM